MIDQEKIQEWVRIYLKHIQEVSLEHHVEKEEGYKFLSINTFLQHFNLADPDLVGMLGRAIFPNNLVVGAMYWPRKMLLIYAEEYPNETREALQYLYDESLNLYDRITRTAESFKMINDKRNTKLGTAANSYIGLRFISLLLGFRYPDKCNALKPVEWKSFARFIDPGFTIPNHTTAGEQYKLYEPYIEALRLHIKDREDMRIIKEALTRGLSFDDSESRWMTQDVIYVTSRVLGEEKSNQRQVVVPTPQNDEVVSDVTTDEEDGTGFMPLEKYLEEYIMKNWDIVDFGEKLTIYRDEDGTPGQQYVTDVGIIDILARDAQENFVVIELKRAESNYHTVGQVLNYMTWVEENLVVGNEKVRGMIVVGKADNTLKSALRQVADKVILKEYKIKLILNNSK